MQCLAQESAKVRILPSVNKVFQLILNPRKFSYNPSDLGMKITRKLRKTLLNISLALLVTLGIINFPQVTLNHPEFSILSPSGAASSNLTRTDQPLVLPRDFKMVNVKANYGAKGDGITDDTTAIQLALNDGRTSGQDYNGKPKAIYFPAGTYLVSDTLKWIGCCVTLQGQGKDSTIIKLKDSAIGYNDPNLPKAVIKTPEGNQSFRQNIWNLSVNTGKNNSGAIALDYISNNIGSIRDVTIQSGDGKGTIGLDMSRQWAGPSLIKKVEINGFDYGIYTRNSEYGLTFEQIALKNQNIAGISNDGNTLAIRELQSINTVPVIQNKLAHGSIILVDGNFQGGLLQNSAIDNNGYLYARNIVTTGYQSAIRNKGTIINGTSQIEYVSNQIYSLFDSPPQSLNLPIEQTPTFNDDNITNWGKFSPRWYGDTGNLQFLLNSGKSTIYFPFGTYFSYNKKVVTVPATVQRIIGYSSVVNRGPDGGGIVFRVEENSDQPLIIEQFGYGVSVEHVSARPVVIKHGRYGYSDSSGAGKLFLEDVGMSALNLNYPHSVWARQLNIESLDAPRTKITNKGGTLWILGLKTEGKGTVINTSTGGKTELLGTLVYPVQEFTAEDKKQAAFINHDSSQSLIYSVSVYGVNRNYDIQVEETRNGVTRQLLSKDIPGRMPLFVGIQK